MADVATTVKPAVADPTKGATVKQLTPAPFTIRPLKSDHRYIKFVVYGPFGVGKTSLAGSAIDVPGMDDVIMVNAESGTLSIEDAEHIKNRDYIDQVPCTDFKTVALVQEFLKAHCNARDKNDIKTMKLLQSRTFGVPVEVISEDAEDDVFTVDEDGQRVYEVMRLRRFRTVIVDSLTEIDTYSMYQLLGIKTDMKLDEDMDVAQFAEFRKNNQMMQLLVRAYRDLPMNVILVCSTQYNQDELKQFHWVPSLTGKLANQVQGFVDVVGYLVNGKPKEGSNDIPRRLFIQPIGKFDAKCRIASFKQPYIDDPTMSKLMAAFRNVQQLKSPAKASK